MNDNSQMKNQQENPEIDPNWYSYNNYMQTQYQQPQTQYQQPQTQYQQPQTQYQQPQTQYQQPQTQYQRPQTQYQQPQIQYIVQQPTSRTVPQTERGRTASIIAGVMCIIPFLTGALIKGESGSGLGVHELCYMLRALGSSLDTPFAILAAYLDISLMGLMIVCFIGAAKNIANVKAGFLIATVITGGSAAAYGHLCGGNIFTVTLALVATAILFALRSFSIDNGDRTSKNSQPKIQLRGLENGPIGDVNGPKTWRCHKCDTVNKAGTVCKGCGEPR